MGPEVGRRAGGYIDEPGPDTVLEPTDVQVHGWAYRTGHRVAGVDVFLDGDRLGSARIGLARPAVADVLQEDDAATSGFELRTILAPFRSYGRRWLRAVVTFTDRTQEELGPVPVVCRPPVLGHLDEPAPGAVLDPTALRVRGWAHGVASPVSRVDVFLDGQWLGRAGLGRPRPLVATALAQPGAILSGFDLLAVGTATPTEGPASLRAVVTQLDGNRLDLGPVPVRLRLAPPLPQPPLPATTRRRLPPAGETIRVLWSARSLDHGGSQLRLADLIRHLAADGRFHNTVLSPMDGPLRTALEAVGAAVHVGFDVPLDDARAYERAVSRLGRWMNERFDLVVGASVTSFPAVDVAVRTGVPGVLRIGEAEPLRTVADWLLGPLDPAVEEHARQAVGTAAAVLSNSHAAVATYRAHGYTGRFTIIPTGADVAAARAHRHATDRNECRRSLGIHPRERLLVCVGTLWSVKGQAVLAMALQYACGRNLNLTCALLGQSDGEYGAAISNFLVSHGLGETVRVLPFQSDLRPWWCAADVVVCASESESLPASVLEGMSFGLPALSTDVGDVPLLVEPGVTGWLVDHADLGSMAAGLEAVASASSGQLTTMGTAAAQRVERRFDRTDLLDRVKELLVAVATDQAAALATPR